MQVCVLLINDSIQESLDEAPNHHRVEILRLSILVLLKFFVTLAIYIVRGGIGNIEDT